MYSGSSWYSLCLQIAVVNWTVRPLAGLQGFIISMRGVILALKLQPHANMSDNTTRMPGLASVLSGYPLVNVQLQPHMGTTLTNREPEGPYRMRNQLWAMGGSDSLYQNEIVLMPQNSGGPCPSFQAPGSGAPIIGSLGE
jgi:hypothetical protein